MQGNGTRGIESYGLKVKERKKEQSLIRVKKGQTKETKERNWQKDKGEITQRHGLKLKKTERGRRWTKLQEDRIKNVRKILNETKRDIGQLFLPVSERLQTAVDERAALYEAVLSALALAVALRLTTQRSVLKVRRGRCYHGPQLHTHRLCSTHARAFLCTGRYKHTHTRAGRRCRRTGPDWRMQPDRDLRNTERFGYTLSYLLKWEHNKTTNTWCYLHSQLSSKSIC